MLPLFYFLLLLFQTQPVELSTIADVKYRHREDCDDLMASSPILSVRLPTKKLQKPLTIQMPVPPNPHKKQRPTTAVDRNDKPSGGKGRPTSAFLPTFKKEGER